MLDLKHSDGACSREKKGCVSKIGLIARLQYLSLGTERKIRARAALEGIILKISRICRRNAYFEVNVLISPSRRIVIG